MKYKYIFIISNDQGAFENNLLIYNSIKKNSNYIAIHFVLKSSHQKEKDKKTILLDKYNFDYYLDFIKKKEVKFFLFSNNLENSDYEKKIHKYVLQKNINSGFIQDYWGSFGDFGKKLPKNIFLLDNLSRKISLKKKITSSLFITGLPKFSKMKRYKKNTNFNNIIFIIGQPLDLPGIKYNLKILLSKIKKYKKYQILYRPHPSDIAYIDFLKKYPFVKISKSKNYKSLIINSKFTFTFFSSLGIEHAYIQSYSNFYISSLYYCLIGKKINEYIKRSTNTQSFPPKYLGIGNVITKENNIDIIFNKSDFELKKKYVLNSKKVFNLKNNPVSNIVKIILS